jgi:hypothetical protein
MNTAEAVSCPILVTDYVARSQGSPLGHLLGKATVRLASSLAFLCPPSVILPVPHNIRLALTLYTANNENVTK